MATAVQKIASLGNTRDIPFNKLVLSQSNVRRVKGTVSIEDLAESIAHRGLLQNLNVRPVVDAEGQETGLFEVPAGGRRFRALELLVKTKRLAKTAPVACNVREACSPISAEEDSLAENTHREDLHPLDQFRAFQVLVERGLRVEDIAARFFVTPQVVRQRLKLASVAPKLLDVYAEDGMTLDLLMAFTVSADHARQEQVWEALARQNYREPYQVRRALTEGAVRASDKRAQFVGVGVYEGAGGIVLRDLFQTDDGGWLQDPALLDMLAIEKLREEARAVAAEGWKWVEVAIGFPHGHDRALRRLHAAPVLTEEEQATYDALQTEYGTIEETYSNSPDDLPHEVDQRFREIGAALDVFHNRSPSFEPADMARAGAFVGIDGAGNLKVKRGFVRPEDETPIVEPEVPASDGGEEMTANSYAQASGAMPPVQRAVITVGGASDPEPAEEDEGVKPLPERLLAELTAHRTLALRDAVASSPHVATTALLHKLVSDTFQGVSASGGCLEVSVRHVFFPAQADDLKDSASAKAIDERQKAWASDLPFGDDQAVWDWLDVLDEASRSALLAHCVSFGVNALVEKVDRYGGAGLSQHVLARRVGQADRLAVAVGLDMADAGWTPTVGNYLGRVTKGRILEAVREAKGEQAAQLIDHLKKGDMAKEAERLLAGTGWVPEPLRTPGHDDTQRDAAPATEGGEPEALPAFLADEDEAVDEKLNPEPHAIAAE